MIKLIKIHQWNFFVYKMELFNVEFFNPNFSFVAILDQRCIRFGIQLGLFCASYSIGLVLYAQFSSRCPQRVSWVIYTCGTLNVLIVHITVCFVNHFWIFYLFISPLWREFSNEKNRVDRRVQYHKFRTKKMFVEAMSSYLDWITQAGFYRIFWRKCFYCDAVVG